MDNVHQDYKDFFLGWLLNVGQMEFVAEDWIYTKG